MNYTTPPPSSPPPPSPPAASGADARLAALGVWVESLRPGARISPLAGDASFRRYFRVDCDGETLVAMDAPPPQEDVARFVAVRDFLDGRMSVPTVHSADLERGFLLLEDFGDETYARALESGADAEGLYQDAIGALVRLQAPPLPWDFPRYDELLLRRETGLFAQWHCGREGVGEGVGVGDGVGAGERVKESPKPKKSNPLGVAGVSGVGVAGWVGGGVGALVGAARVAVERAESFMVAEISRMPVCVVHRDYHTRNLMVLPDGRNPGALDFQDAVLGPATYDLASLARDAYVAPDEGRCGRMLDFYWRVAREGGLKPAGSVGELRRHFDIVSAQRGLKVLGIFCRLAIRDGKRGYLADLPVVRENAMSACAGVEELRELGKVLADIPPPEVG